MDNEYVYFRITRDDQGLCSNFPCFESMFSPGMLDAAIVGIRYKDLYDYYDRAIKHPEDKLPRVWFLVKPHPDISYEDIAEAVKYG